jgi:hypothetical protein
MISITALFNGGPGDEQDNHCRAIFEGHGGVLVGSGTWLPTGERDVEYVVPQGRLKACSAALEAAGYRLKLTEK